MQPIGVSVASATRCPLCGAGVTPDVWGLIDCPCGWGGPGDPLEATRGLNRLITRTDRRLASAAAHRDLARLSRPNWHPGNLVLGYTALLLVLSTLVYLVVGAVILGAVALSVHFALDQAWIGVGVFGIIAIVFISALALDRPHVNGVLAPRERFPQVWAALDDVHRRTGAPLPQRVYLVPDGNFFVYQHRPARRFFRRELVLALGVGALPLMREVELRSVMAHELAHYGHGHTALSRYFARAQRALSDIVNVMNEGSRTQGVRRRVYRAGSSEGFVIVGAALVWIVTLPLRLLLVFYHLLRLAESRAAEFDADRSAIQAYGSQAFADGLTAATTSMHTIARSGGSLRAEMLKHGGTSIYATLRDHYAALPSQVIMQLRLQGVQEFRSLENDHPITPDRLRAAAIANFAVPADVPPRPAIEVITPTGASDASEVERQLTADLFAPKKKGRR
jgi:Zn-dependent protease with chaperone function